MDIETTRPTKINLSLNSIRDEILTTILPKNLIDISLAGNKLGPRSIQSLISYLKENNTVKSLNIESNSLSDANISFVVDVLAYNQVLTSLRLSNNTLDHKTANSISQLVEANNTLGYLGIGWGKLCYTHVELIFDSINSNRDSSIRFIDLF